MTKEEMIASEDLKERYERYKDILKDLTLMNDIFMRNVLKKRECTEYILQVIMGEKDLKVIDQVQQKDYKNLQGRSEIPKVGRWMWKFSRIMRGHLRKERGIIVV